MSGGLGPEDRKDRRKRMLRVIIAALLVYVVWRLWKRASGMSRTQRAGTRPQIAAEMVACRRCGTFVLNTESIDRGGERFCSAECAGSDN